MFFRSVGIDVLQGLALSPNDGTHAGQTGGRYNSPGSAPVCYLAASETLASLEVEQQALMLGISAPRAVRLLYSVSVRDAVVLDVTNPLVVNHLALPPAQLKTPTRQWQRLNALKLSCATQKLGDLVWKLRPDIHGSLYPAGLAGLLNKKLPLLKNLMLFMDSTAPHHPRGNPISLTVHDPTGICAALGLPL